MNLFSRLVPIRISITTLLDAVRHVNIPSVADTLHICAWIGSACTVINWEFMSCIPRLQSRSNENDWKGDFIAR